MPRLRQEVRQFLGSDEEPVLFVEVLQVDHRLAAIAALAVHVLEQVQRQGARAVEQQDVALLAVEEIVVGDLRDQLPERAALISTVSPSSVDTVLGSAPASSSSCTSRALPDVAAAESGEAPNRLNVDGVAPAFNRS